MKKNYFILILLFIFLPLTVTADWPMFMGNQYLTGNNDEIVPHDNHLNWTFSATTFLFYPIVHERKIFVNCLDKNLYALDELTGKVLWKCLLERPAFKSPVTWKNYVLVTSGDHIYSIDIHTGKIYWSRKADGISVQLSTPIVVHSRVYYGSRKFFYARDVRNGHLIWENDKVKIFGGSPIYWNEYIYFLSKDYANDFSQLFCLSAKDGKLQWKKDIPGDPNIFTPVAYNNRIFIGSLNSLYSFNAKSGELTWQRKYKQRLAYHTIIANNKIYLSMDDGTINILNPDNGHPEGSFTNFNATGAKFIIIGETVLIPNRKGKLFSYQTRSKKLNWNFQTDFTNRGSTLSSANGRVYLATGSKLYSISTGNLPSLYPVVASADNKKRIEIELLDSRNNPISGEITLYQNNRPTRHSLKDGKKTIEVEKDKEFTVIANAKDYFVKTIHGNPEDEDKKIEIKMEPLKRDATYVFNDITFQYNSSELKDRSFPTLQAIAKLFQANPRLQIDISGHTDNIGSDNFNLKLSLQRANKVKEFLIKNGIPDIRIKAHGHGESRPVTSNKTEEGREKNRRVEFTIR